MTFVVTLRSNGDIRAHPDSFPNQELIELQQLASVDKPGSIWHWYLDIEIGTDATCSPNSVLRLLRKFYKPLFGVLAIICGEPYKAAMPFGTTERERSVPAERRCQIADVSSGSFIV